VLYGYRNPPHPAMPRYLPKPSTTTASAFAAFRYRTHRRASRVSLNGLNGKNGTVLFPRNGCEELLGQVFNLGVEMRSNRTTTCATASCGCCEASLVRAWSCRGRSGLGRSAAGRNRLLLKSLFSPFISFLESFCNECNAPSHDCESQGSIVLSANVLFEIVSSKIAMPNAVII
jgi:hypothetical protein